MFYVYPQIHIPWGYPIYLTCDCGQADKQTQQQLEADPHREGQGLHPSCGAVACRLATTHADGQGAGAGEGRRAAVHHHHWQQVLDTVPAGESAPSCQDASCIICVVEKTVSVGESDA